MYPLRPLYVVRMSPWYPPGDSIWCIEALIAPLPLPYESPTSYQEGGRDPFVLLKGEIRSKRGSGRHLTSSWDPSMNMLDRHMTLVCPPGAQFRPVTLEPHPHLVPGGWFGPVPYRPSILYAPPYLPHTPHAMPIDPSNTPTSCL